MTREEIEAKLAAFRAANAEAYQNLANTVQCRRCNRVLTDPESIKLGIGPECLAKSKTNVLKLGSKMREIDLNASFDDAGDETYE
jgi:hypothetical protein